jgi:hypothetical protein
MTVKELNDLLDSIISEHQLPNHDENLCLINIVGRCLRNDDCELTSMLQNAAEAWRIHKNSQYLMALLSTTFVMGYNYGQQKLMEETLHDN